MNKALLKYQMETKGINVDALCREIGISKSSFYKKIGGRSEFTRVEIEKICSMLELSSPVDIFFTSQVS